MKIDATEFGSITIEGKRYSHDVVCRLSGHIEKRKKKLSKKRYGTSHVVSLDEAKFVYEKGCDVLVIGTGQHDNVCLAPDAAAFLDRKRCEVISLPTPSAVSVFNQTKAKKIGLFHVTC